MCAQTSHALTALIRVCFQLKRTEALRKEAEEREGTVLKAYGLVVWELFEDAVHAISLPPG